MSAEEASRDKDSDLDMSDDIDEESLFGSGPENGEEGVGSRHRLDDADLDSGDDEGRDDRMGGDDYGNEDVEVPQRELKVGELSLGRHQVPRGSDGELYHLKFPNSVGIEPKAFTLHGFEPPKTDHDGSEPPPSNFSAFNTSINTIRFRKHPNDSSVVQSNARILRWSDGSLTLQIASNPLVQYELKPKGLSSPQVNPNAPTPTSLTLPNHPPNTVMFDPVLELNNFLAAPHEHAQILRHTNHITTALTLQSEEQDDEALQRLQEQMAVATKGNKTSADGGLEVISITEDPELAKKRAELAEKEKNAAQRKLQVQQDKETSRANNVLRRSGLRTGGMGVGLTVGGLEDEDGMGATKGRMPKPKSRKAKRRNSEYSEDEEEFRGKGRSREDEYDEDDGFLVGSDEEPEVGEDDEEEEDDADMDAEGEDDDEVPEPVKPNSKAAAPSARAKSKRVIEDEDEE